MLPSKCTFVTVSTADSECRQATGRQTGGKKIEAQHSHWLLQGTGYRAQGTGYRVQGTGYRIQGTGYRVQGTPVVSVKRKSASTSRRFLTKRESE